jgi:plasmid stability protein
MRATIQGVPVVIDELMDFDLALSGYLLGAGVGTRRRTPRCACIMHAECYHISMANVQIRGVPDDVHRQLKSQAALAGKSLNEYLLSQLADIADVPTIPQLLARIEEREPYTGPSSAAIIREARDGR